MPDQKKQQNQKPGEKRKAGRPKSKATIRKELIAASKARRGVSLTNGRKTDYDPEFCHIVLEIGEMGGSLEKAMNAIGCSKPTFYTWTRNHPEFLNAVKESKIARLAWWETAAQGQASGKSKGNSAVTAFVMRNISAGIDDPDNKPYTNKVEFEGRVDSIVENKDISPETVQGMDESKKRDLLEILNREAETE